MPSTAQYSALTRLLCHNTKVHELEDLLLRLPVPEDDIVLDEESLELEYEHHSNPISDLQEDLDKEVRASLVASWFALPMDMDDLNEV